ncbi:Rieske 2Fe-2S domain-containing protein [Marinitenerispora sediminis]|uniref:(2Fe-2S)-binding protein n=1 Tax=Marinitenerispora sediminis TaxID=1931232 RepID=A0A368TA89_9ACTN|nr:Rieske (2Fe-2S) protein [Marinitenerispora sediminis]RCV54104.1 (2Fe-2S)-binding protein [Marinitenerispora sediminis]RCV56827.1 (2Fe-2S)-binding protein [Marinitenerispora sediminis]RCV61538.1 (2Fe-2S)-binding protein [Marinitenerispora sediminis]
MRVAEQIRRIERMTSLDRTTALLRRAVEALPLGRFRDTLHGIPLGHPLHPVLVQLPIGAWVSAAVLDSMPGYERAAHRLVTAGMLAAAPAALAGAVDWSRQQQRHRRVGLVHAAANTAAVGLYALSSAARTRGRHGLGRALGLAGLTTVGVGGLLGGHIAYSLAGGASHADYLLDRLPSEWHDIGAVHEFTEGEPVHGMLGDTPIMAVRTGEDVRVLVETCGHMGGPLSRGTVRDGCVTCPWHGSTFRLTDGAVMRGPATAPQPVLEVRIRDGVVSVRRPRPVATVPRQRGETVPVDTAAGKDA